MVRALYSAAMHAAQPLLRRKLARRAVAEPGYAHAVPERFGQYTHPPETRRDRVWVHAVSLGETRAAAILLKALRAQLPGMRLLLTHGTATGRAEGEKLLRPDDVQAWLPWDTPSAVERFLTHFKPAFGVLMETEVWPNLVAGCQRLQVPLALVNARMNARTLARSRRLAPLAYPSYRGLAFVLAQTEDDAQRLRQLQAPVQAVTGNIKFDVDPDVLHVTQGRMWRQSRRLAGGPPVLMLASSRAGEEAFFLQQFSPNNGVDTAAPAIKNKAIQLLIVPRHPQRFDEVEALARARGWQVSRRSHWDIDGPPPASSDTRPLLWLGDSMGEMALYYSLADLALLGGSFEPLGGQNLIEGAACGCPIIAGPHTFNFADATDKAVLVGAARRASGWPQARQQALAWLADDAARQSAAQSALLFAQTHRGGAEATARYLSALW